MKKARVVKITEELVKRLKPFGARFIKVAKPVRGDRRTGKAAIEYGYLLKPYEADDPELLGWLKEGGNYGVVFGRGVYGLDIDDPGEQERFEAKVQTFTVRSGGGEGKHYYIMGNLTENGTILDEGRNLGNVQVKNKHVVGPNSVHWSGGTYEIEKDLPLAWVTVEKLNEIFGEKLQWSGDSRKREEADAEETGRFIDAHIPMEEIVDISGFSRLSGDEWQGEHPIHGSTTGTNLSVNVDKNIWHCWRCNSGGGPLHWLAVREGLMKCHECKPGSMTGTLFLGAVDIARGLGYDIAKMEGEEDIPKQAKRFFEGRIFIPLRLAREILMELHVVTLPGPETYVYDETSGIYKAGGKILISKAVHAKLGEAQRNNRLNEVLKFIEVETFRNEADEAAPELLAVENGILDVLTGELKPFTPDEFITSKLPVKYNPEASAVLIKKFVSEVVDPRDGRSLQEFSGYCLYKSQIFDKTVLFYGIGANGKSTFLDALEALLGGKANVTNKQLHALMTDRFALADLRGKLANICPDLSSLAFADATIFKALTGGDSVDAQRKFGHAFSFRPYLKLISGCNVIPPIKGEATRAFFRRWILINFPFVFEGDNCDPHLTQKLTTPEALSGMLNWALEGLARLMANQGFTESKSTAETREWYVKLSDPARHLIEAAVEGAEGAVLPKDDLYAEYVRFCTEEKLPLVSKRTFNARVEQCLPGVKSARIRVDGKKTPCWMGYRLAVSSVARSLSAKEFKNENKIIDKSVMDTRKRPERTGKGGNWLEEHRRKEVETA